MAIVFNVKVTVWEFQWKHRREKNVCWL